MSEFEEASVSRATLRFRAIQRMLMWRYLSGTLPLYLVAEFPKSGGTWYAKMLSECIGVPFPKPFSQPKLQKMVLRDHRLYHPKYENVTVVMRDGRDIMVSAYFHFLFHNEANMNFAVDERRKLLAFRDFDDLEENLPKFIEYMFEVFPKQGWGMRFSWSTFVDSWINQDVAQVRYEDLLLDPVTTMKSATERLTGKKLSDEFVSKIVSKYSFESLTGRKSGIANPNSFARKGVAGDWKNHFNRNARQLFCDYAGDRLIQLGYEQNTNWVDP